MSFVFFITIANGQRNSYTDSLKLVVSQSHDDTNKLKAMVLLGWELRNLNLDTSILIETNALKLADDISRTQLRGNDSVMILTLMKWIANAKGHLGVYDYMKGNYSSALNLYFEALRIDRETGNKKGQAKHLGNIGNVYTNLGEYTVALEYLIEALQLDEELSKSTDAAIAKNAKQGVLRHLGNIGIVYEEQAESTVNPTIRSELFSKALEYYNRALVFAAGLEGKPNTSNILGNIGVVYRQLGNFDKSLDYYKRALEMDEKKGDKDGIARHLGNIGNVYGTMAKAAIEKESNDLFNMALEYFFKSLKLKTELGDKEEIAATLGNIGLIYSGTGKYFEAEKYFINSLKISEEINSMRLIKDNRDHLSELYEKKGEWKKSLEFYKGYIVARDSMSNEEHTKKRTQLEMQFEFDKKETAAKAEQDKKDVLAKNELQHQQRIRNSVIIICLILIAFGGLVFNRFKLKKKIENQQALLNERMRISNELHDDLGSQLSTARMFLQSLKSNTEKNLNQSLVENSLNLIDSSINDLRKIMDDLQVSTLQEKGYIIATEELVNKINQLQQMHFNLSHHGIDKRIDSKTEHNLFRITQELINNTLKYAKAKNVSIDLIIRDGKIVLLFEDDGEGFDLQNVKKGQGLGNITSRTQAVGGTVEFDSRPGSGARTIIEMPLKYEGQKS